MFDSVVKCLFAQENEQAGAVLQERNHNL